jgi:type III restriction enzyme
LEQSAAYYLDRSRTVEAFVKNSDLGFAIPYLHNGQTHDYVPDFHRRSRSPCHLIVETKRYDPLEEVKWAAVDRWVATVNADGTHGQWRFTIAEKVSDIPSVIESAAGKE